METRSIPQLREKVASRIANPFRFGLYLILASTPLLAISGEVFGLVSLRTVSGFFLFPLLGIVAILVVLGYGLWVSQPRAKRGRSPSVSTKSRTLACPPPVRVTAAPNSSWAAIEQPIIDSSAGDAEAA